MGQGAGRYQGQALQEQNPMRCVAVLPFRLFSGARADIFSRASSRDTALFPAYTYTVIRFVADNPGMWSVSLRRSRTCASLLTCPFFFSGHRIFHCHLVWHMASGLAMQYSILPQATAGLVADGPSILSEQCATMRSLAANGTQPSSRGDGYTP